MRENHATSATEWSSCDAPTVGVELRGDGSAVGLELGADGPPCELLQRALPTLCAASRLAGPLRDGLRCGGPIIPAEVERGSANGLPFAAARAAAVTFGQQEPLLADAGAEIT